MKKDKKDIFGIAKEQMNNRIKEVRAEFKPILEKVKKIRRLKGVNKKDTRFFVTASELTCYGSLAYCCDTIKPCIWRDNAMVLLGITAKELKEAKEDFNKELLNDFKAKQRKKG